MTRKTFPARLLKFNIREVNKSQNKRHLCRMSPYSKCSGLPHSHDNENAQNGDNSNSEGIFRVSRHILLFVLLKPDNLIHRIWELANLCVK